MILSIYQGEWGSLSVNKRSSRNSQLCIEEINCALQGDRGARTNVGDKLNG